MDPPAVTATNLSETENKRPPVIIGFKNRLATITTRHHMVNCPRILESYRSRHTLGYPINPSLAIPMLIGEDQGVWFDSLQLFWL